MELILNTNKLGYKPFLSADIDSLIIGLKNFCVNQPFSLSAKELKNAIRYKTPQTLVEKDVAEIDKIIQERTDKGE